MTRLTEEMVVARSKQSDLSSIKKLNCWGAELTDVSILKKMANVEVLALSINKIRTLVDFQHCRRLKELYVRKNRVADLSEIRHLRTLPALKILWLDENPCAEHANYRMTVLRALPNLEKLDNIDVDPDEVEEAVRKGSPIYDSDAEEDYEPELENFNNQYWNKNEENNPSERNGDREEYRNGEQDNDRGQDAYESAPVQSGFSRSSALRRSPPVAYNNRNVQEYDNHNVTANHNYTNSRPSALPRSPPNTNGSNYNQTSPGRQRAYSPDTIEETRYEQPAPRTQYFEMNGDHSRERERDRERERYQSQQPSSRHSVTSPHGECYYDRQADRYSSQTLESSNQPLYNNSHPRTSLGGTGQQTPADTAWERDSVMSASRVDNSQIASAVMAEHKGFTRRPITRSSNLLSAVLCLVKELDYTSLEVTEMAVRCRMDELANRP